jgi:hypothetical protein
MDDTFVTVGRFHRLDEANFAKSLLDAAGIAAILVGDNTVGLAWHLSPALGGVRLQVRQQDAEVARAILRPPDSAAAAEPGASSDGPDSPLTDLDPQRLAEAEAEEQAAGRLTPREELAVRAFRAAIIGLVLPPVHIYATWLLLRVLLTRGRLPLRFWARLGVALVANAVAWTVFLLVLWPLQGTPVHFGSGCSEQLPVGFP